MSKGKHENGKKSNYREEDEIQKEDRKPRNNNSRRQSSPKRRSNPVKSINDVAWYSKNPQLLKDAGSIPFSNIQGLNIHLPGMTKGGAEYVDKLPGLITMPATPTYGVTGYDYSAVNVAAQNIYSFIRHQNSGHSNYDVPDLFMYLAAMDQMYSYHAELVRIYGLMRFYNGYNRYVGRYLVQALGFDYDNLTVNLAQFRYLINQFAIKLSSLAVPAVMPIVDRHRWMYSNVYMDKPNLKAQLYAFVPRYYGQYIEPNNTAVSVNTPYAYLAAVSGQADETQLPYGWDIFSISQRINGFMENLLGSEDIGIMSGDILKAYGAPNCYMVNSLSEDYVVSPVYVPDPVLQQIHNATAVGDPQFITNEDNVPQLLYQNGTDPFLYGWSSTVLPMYYGKTASSNLPAEWETPTGNWLFDVNAQDPTPELVVEASRLTTLPSSVTKYGEEATETFRGIPGHEADVTVYKQNYLLGFEHLPADVISEFRIYSGEVDGSHNNYPVYAPIHSWMWKSIGLSSGSASIFFSMWIDRALADMSKFDLHPIVRTDAFIDGPSGNSVNPNFATYSNVVTNYHGQLENYAVIDPEVFGRLHDTALLSLLDVPTTSLSKGI